MISERKLVVKITIDVPVEKAWELYKNPLHNEKWNIASDDWTCTIISNDMVVGGTILAKMEANDGSISFDFEGVYDFVNEHRSFMYTKKDGRKFNTIFEDCSGCTKVTFAFDPDVAYSSEIQRMVWDKILHNYKKYAELL